MTSATAFTVSRRRTWFAATFPAARVSPAAVASCSVSSATDFTIAPTASSAVSSASIFVALVRPRWERVFADVPAAFFASPPTIFFRTAPRTAFDPRNSNMKPGAARTMSPTAPPHVDSDCSRFSIM